MDDIDVAGETEPGEDSNSDDWGGEKLPVEMPLNDRGESGGAGESGCPGLN